MVVGFHSIGWFSFYRGFMLLWMMNEGYEINLTVSGKL